MPFLNHDDAELYYEVHGEGAPLVFVHGIGGNHAIWYRQVACFSRCYRVVSYDQRGFGRSSDPQQRGRAALVDDLRALLDHLGIDKAALVGQSLGGGTCTGFARRWPERVAALVLADTLHGIAEDATVKSIMDRARAATAGLDQLERVLGKAHRESSPESTFLYRQISSFNTATRHTLRGEWGPPCALDELAAAGMPILFIAGSEDVLFPIAAVRLVQAQVKGSFLVELNGAGHSAFWEQPVEFNDSVASVLQMAGLRPLARVHSNNAGYGSEIQDA